MVGEDCSAGDGLAGRGGVELDDQREDQPGDEAEEPLVVTEEDPKSFGDREDKLSVGKGEQQVLVEVLGEEKGPLLAAGRTQAVQWPALGVKPTTREGAEVLKAALGVRTSDAGNALPVVAAGEKACRNAGDPLDAEVAELLRVARIVVRREAGEVVSEHMLQGVCAPLGIDRPR